MECCMFSNLVDQNLHDKALSAETGLSQPGLYTNLERCHV